MALTAHDLVGESVCGVGLPVAPTVRIIRRMADPLVILTTVGTEEEANKLAVELIDRRLAACVNINRGVTSVFRWKGEIQRDSEYLLIIKTVDERFTEVSEAICELHSYECPEILAMKARPGDLRFLDWLEQSTVAESPAAEES